MIIFLIMKIKNKKTLSVEIKITTLCLIIAASFAVVYCKKQENPQIKCTFDNPLTDLNWLKKKISDFNLLAQESKNLSINVYQCVHGNNETCFFIDDGNSKTFYNCNGELLCLMNEFTGETCSGLNITSKELIWEINFPAEISYTEYLIIKSVEITSCQWSNFEPETIIIVNSEKELRNYYICDDAENSNIDFSKHSLLIVRGVAMYGIIYFKIAFLRETVNKYSLNINIHTNAICHAPHWYISIITPKLDDEATIKLNVQQIRGY